MTFTGSSRTVSAADQGVASPAAPLAAQPARPFTTDPESVDTSPRSTSYAHASVRASPDEPCLN